MSFFYRQLCIQNFSLRKNLQEFGRPASAAANAGLKCNFSIVSGECLLLQTPAAVLFSTW
jgi:hypothetical protein